MARGNPVDLANRSFATQGLATSFFKEMLGRYQPTERVDELDTLDLASLLERHEEYAAKAGCGISHFEVMMTEHGTPCFRIVRTDGSGTDFSYRHCITQRPPTRKQEVSQAFRRVVRVDLYDARDRFFTANKDAQGFVTCAETGEKISRDNAHMDHSAKTIAVTPLPHFQDCATVINADEADLWEGLQHRFEVQRINHEEAYCGRGLHELLGEILLTDTVLWPKCHKRSEGPALLPGGLNEFGSENVGLGSVLLLKIKQLGFPNIPIIKPQKNREFGP